MSSLYNELNYGNEGDLVGLKAYQNTPDAAVLYWTTDEPAGLSMAADFLWEVQVDSTSDFAETSADFKRYISNEREFVIDKAFQAGNVIDLKVIVGSVGAASDLPAGFTGATGISYYVSGLTATRTWDGAAWVSMPVGFTADSDTTLVAIGAQLLELNPGIFTGATVIGITGTTGSSNRTLQLTLADQNTPISFSSFGITGGRP
jgi:hypothetical protein